jgi:hypothetical protein
MLYEGREYATWDFFSKENVMGILKYACRDFIEKLERLNLYNEMIELSMTGTCHLYYT